MSRENVEVVRETIDAYNRGDWDAALENTAPGFVWDNSAAMGDYRGVYTTPEQIRGVWANAADVWESVRVELDELIPVGEHVAAPHTSHMRGRDGIEVQGRTTWLFTLRHGKIERLCLYQDRQEALEAAGLSE